MDKKKNKKKMALCPVGGFFQDINKAFGKKSEFFNQLTLSRVEFLKAFRGLVDKKIEGLEKKGFAGKGKRWPGLRWNNCFTLNHQLCWRDSKELEINMYQCLGSITVRQ